MQNGRGTTQQDYLAFWSDALGQRSATAVRVFFPPHEAPRGGILEELVVLAIKDQHTNADVTLLGAVSMYGTDREIVVGDGRVASACLEGSGWRVHL